MSHAARGPGEHTIDGGGDQDRGEQDIMMIKKVRICENIEGKIMTIAVIKMKMTMKLMDAITSVVMVLVGNDDGSNIRFNVCIYMKKKRQMKIIIMIINR